MIKIALTGSIGMGKSTTANFFRQAGVPVHDSDAVVHRLYEGEAVAPVEAAFPGVTVDGKIDRGKLAENLVGNPEAIKRLEAIVHPLVRAVSEHFTDQQRARAARLIVLDIPLLFETGAEKRVDAVEAAVKQAAAAHPQLFVGQFGDASADKALNKAFGLGGKAGESCALGSVKSNIGHLDTASGVAGLIKTVLVLQNRAIPGSLHFTAPNPEIDFASGPFRVVQALTEWPEGAGPRRH